MVKSKEELLESARAVIGDSTTDESIALLEDIADTLAEMDNSENEKWKEKYEENDKMWREKYIARFEGKPVEPENKEEVNPNTEKLTFESLFEEVG